jgi:hypothetical protein
MSLEEKYRHSSKPGKTESRARNLRHKFDLHKMTNVVNHVHFERRHGYESTKHHDKQNGAADAA